MGLILLGAICFFYHVSAGNSGYHDTETIVYYLKLLGDIVLIVGGALENYLKKIYKLLKADYPKYLAEHEEGKLAERIGREFEENKEETGDFIASILAISTIILGLFFLFFKNAS